MDAPLVPTPVTFSAMALLVAQAVRGRQRRPEAAGAGCGQRRAQRRVSIVLPGQSSSSSSSSPDPLAHPIIRSPGPGRASGQVAGGTCNHRTGQCMAARTARPEPPTVISRGSMAGSMLGASSTHKTLLGTYCAHQHRTILRAVVGVARQRAWNRFVPYGGKQISQDRCGDGSTTSIIPDSRHTSTVGWIPSEHLSPMLSLTQRASPPQTMQQQLHTSGRGRCRQWSDGRASQCSRCFDVVSDITVDIPRALLLANPWIARIAAATNCGSRQASFQIAACQTGLRELENRLAKGAGACWSVQYWSRPQLSCGWPASPAAHYCRGPVNILHEHHLVCTVLYGKWSAPLRSLLERKRSHGGGDSSGSWMRHIYTSWANGSTGDLGGQTETAMMHSTYRTVHSSTLVLVLRADQVAVAKDSTSMLSFSTFMGAREQLGLEMAIEVVRGSNCWR
nr:hypothetical protein CFP56_38895 [Quercus suber]